MSSLPTTSATCQVPDIIPYYLPGGGLSLLAGGAGVGKTALVASLLRAVRDNQSIFGHIPTPVPAIGFINADRSWVKGAGIWFDRAGFSEIRRYSLTDDPTFNVKRLRRRHERTDVLAALIDKLTLPPGSLVVPDPVSVFLGGNLLDYDTCFVAAQEIRAYLRQRQYTLWGTAHSAKLKANKQDRYLRLQDQILGSTALLGFADTQMYLASPEELQKPYYAFLWHPHGAKAEMHYLDRDDQGLFVPWDGADTVNQRRVLGLFPESDLTEFGMLVELAQAIPLSRRTVKNTLDQLIDRGIVERVEHGRYRRIPVH